MCYSAACRHRTRCSTSAAPSTEGISADGTTDAAAVPPAAEEDGGQDASGGVVLPTSTKVPSRLRIAMSASDLGGDTSVATSPVTVKSEPPESKPMAAEPVRAMHFIPTDDGPEQTAGSTHATSGDPTQALQHEHLQRLLKMELDSEQDLDSDDATGTDLETGTDGLDTADDDDAVRPRRRSSSATNTRDPTGEHAALPRDHRRTRSTGCGDQDDEGRSVQNGRDAEPSRRPAGVLARRAVSPPQTRTRTRRSRATRNGASVLGRELRAGTPTAVDAIATRRSRRGSGSAALALGVRSDGGRAGSMRMRRSSGGGGGCTSGRRGTRSRTSSRSPAPSDHAPTTAPSSLAGSLANTEDEGDSATAVGTADCSSGRQRTVHRTTMRRHRRRGSSKGSRGMDLLAPGITPVFPIVPFHPSGFRIGRNERRPQVPGESSRSSRVVCGRRCVSFCCACVCMCHCARVSLCGCRCVSICRAHGV